MGVGARGSAGAEKETLMNCGEVVPGCGFHA